MTAVECRHQRRRVTGDKNKGYKPILKEEWWLNDTTPAYAFVHPDGYEVWI